MAAISKPDYFDAGRRATREKFFRLMEARRVLDGDTFGLLIRDGTMELIESDCVRDPSKPEARATCKWIQGVRTGKGGRALEYAFHNRADSVVGL